MLESLCARIGTDEVLQGDDGNMLQAINQGEEV